MDREAVLNTLIRIMELELAGAARRTHYPLMVQDFNRLPIVAWLKKQAGEAPVSAPQTGKPATWPGGRRSLAVGPLPESAIHAVGNFPRASPDQERESLKAYRDLLDLSKDKNLRLEEYARDMIAKRGAC
jgi:bacterioferritin